MPVLKKPTPYGVRRAEVVEPDAREELARRIAAGEAESTDELPAALYGLRDDVRELAATLKLLTVSCQQTEWRLKRVETLVTSLVTEWVAVVRKWAPVARKWALEAEKQAPEARKWALEGEKRVQNVKAFAYDKEWWR